MKCPDCKNKLTEENFDSDYDWYECPKCEGCFTLDEIQIKASLQKSKAVGNDARLSSLGGASKSAGKVRPLAKGKKKLAEIAEDEEALAKHEAESLKPRASQKDEVHHRDEVPTREILNVIADEIETIAEEIGVKVDRVNAREFYAMNLWRPLSIHMGVKARDKSVPHSLCKDHK